MKKTALQIKVLLINTLNQYAKTIYEYEKKHFAQFLGMEIFKVDGSLKAKYEHEKLTFKGKLEDGTFYDIHYWFEYNYHTFKIHVKACVSGGSYDVKPNTAFCQYEEKTLYIFDTKEAPHPSLEKALLKYTVNVLTEPQGGEPDFKCDYDEKNLLAIAERIKEAAAAYEKAERDMPYQFKDVLHIERLSR